MNELTWTKTKPTVPGIYWTKNKNRDNPHGQRWSQVDLDTYKNDWYWWAGPIPEDQLPQDPDPADAAWESLDSVPSRDYLPDCRQFGGLYINKDLFRDLYHAFKQLIEKEEK